MSAKYGFGVDVGGTSVKLGRFSVEGTLLEKWEIKTDCTDKGVHILPSIASTVQENITKNRLLREELCGIGIAVPGPVDAAGIVNKCVNLGWDTKMDVAARLEKLTGLPVAVANDGNAAALGEMWCGSAKGHRNVVMFTLGTGIGGGVIVDGRVIAGANGAGGEVGHIPLNPEEAQSCPCGNYGCAEQYASATGLVRTARKLLRNAEEPSLLSDAEPLDAKAVWQAYTKDDKIAQQAVASFSEYLGRAAAAISCVADPEVFVLGGGMSKAGEIVAQVVQQQYTKFAFHASKHTPFVLAKLGNDAGIFGCMYMAIARLL